MAIKIASLGDYPEYADQLAHWFKEHFGKYHPERDLYAWSIDLHFNKYKLPITLIALEEIGNDVRLVGTTTLCVDKSYVNDKDTVWLKRTYVPPAERGKNIAAELITACITIAEKLQRTGEPIQEIMLLTRSANELYKKYGWVELDKPSYLAGPAALMTRKI
ncbi:MAG: GNAT family N-acetyltransferase [Gammaproteobacteria bacterium]